MSMQTFVRGTARAAASLVLLAIVAVCAAWIAPSFLGMERYVITGGSMSGTFEKGSVVFSEPVPVDQLEVGDVITYLPPPDSGVTTLVTHRITAIRAGEDGARVLRTQGDANPDPDPWRFSLTAETQPVVRHAVPYVGHAFIALADRRVRIAVIGLPASLVALVALRDLVSAVNPRRRSAAGTSAGRAPDALPVDTQTTTVGSAPIEVDPAEEARARAVAAARLAQTARTAEALAARAAREALVAREVSTADASDARGA